MTIFVANFDYETEESDFKTLFGNFGTVEDVQIARHWRTDKWLGYAFVEMPIDAEAKRAIEELDGRRWNGQRLKVSEKQSKRRRY